MDFVFEGQGSGLEGYSTRTQKLTLATFLDF